MNTHDFIIKALEEAGELLMRLRDESFETMIKNDNPRDIVTSVDLRVNELLTTRIKEAFPEHGIHSEETEDTGAGKEYLWSIDPIDGSSNFSRGIPHFAICLGLMERGVPIAGGIYNPVTRELFSYEKGKGAFCNGKPVAVSSVTSLSKATVFLTVGRNEALWDWGTNGYRSLLRAANKTRNFASTSLDVAFVAAGRIEACVYGTLSTLDIAPAIGILMEAGGMMVDENGMPVTYTTAPQRVYAINNPKLLQELREHI